MATVIFTQNLRRHVDIDRVDVDGATVAEGIQEVFEHYPRLRSYLLDDTGAVRRHVVILIDGKAIADRQTLTDPLPKEAKMFVVQALSGG